MYILDKIHIAGQYVSHDELFEDSDLVSSIRTSKLNLIVSHPIIRVFETSFETKRTFLVYISDIDSCKGLPRRTNPKYSIEECLEANRKF